MKKIGLLLLTIVGVVALTGCKKEYKDYMDSFDGFTATIGDLTNDESVQDLVDFYGDETASNIKVLPVDDMDDDFIFGVDMSSILEVEENGGVFYNELGEEQDVFEILKNNGINYVRIRLWVDPYSEEGEAFGGGTTDTARGIEIAKRAARVGMRICIDFHYSDFWADPGKQEIPRAWKLLNDTDLKETLYNYTYDTVKEFEEAGVRPHMVQVGNEINNGMMYPKGRLSLYGYDRLAELLSVAIGAVNDISEDILIVIHIAEGASEQRVTYFFDNILEYDVEFDIIGLSYYSFWHGPLSDLYETLEIVDERYEQDVIIMEYSYGWTDYSNEYASNIYNSGLEADGGYKTSLQGQVSYIRDVNAAIASIDSGIGSFYWEPAWLAVDGSGWAFEGARTYLEGQGDASGLGKVSWANQALFSYSGKVLPSIKVFDLMSTSSFDEELIVDYEDEMNIILNIKADDTLPSNLIVYTNLDRRTLIPITWNQSDLDSITTPGDYVVNGTIENAGVSYPVTANVEAYENYFINSSFEDGGKVPRDITDFSTVNGWDVTSNVDTAVKIESKNARTDDNQGFNNLNLWANTAYDFTLTQEIELEPGTYVYSVWARSADNMSPVEMYITGTNIDIEQSIEYGATWSQWVQNSFEFTITETTIITIGIKGSCPAESWSHFEDFTLRAKD